MICLLSKVNLHNLDTYVGQYTHTHSIHMHLILIMKGKHMKPEFLDGLPPESAAYMNPTSAYISCYSWDGKQTTFNRWSCWTLLWPHNTQGYWWKQIFICLPNHTTHYVHPIHKSFFKPLKRYFLSRNSFMDEKQSIQKNYKTSSRSLNSCSMAKSSHCWQCNCRLWRIWHILIQSQCN